MNTLNVVLWSIQGFLALFFLAAGTPKLIGRGLERWTGFSDVPRPLVVFIGVTEVLGAAGLVVPMVTGIAPWLTPLAALGLAIIVLMATGFHLRADERINALETGLLGQHRRRDRAWALGSPGRLSQLRCAVGPGCRCGSAGTGGHHQSHRALQASGEQRHRNGFQTRAGSRCRLSHGAAMTVTPRAGRGGQPHRV